jgi:hypothetical protein
VSGSYFESPISWGLLDRADLEISLIPLHKVVAFHWHLELRDSSAARTRITFITFGELSAARVSTFPLTLYRWKPFDPARNFPDLGPQFAEAERIARHKNETALNDTGIAQEPREKVTEDKRDLDWATVLKRTFEAYIRGERPNMYGEWLQW